MDDHNAFERQLAEEIDYEVGPPRSVDALAITHAAMATTQRWRIRTMFSAFTSVVAGIAAVAAGVLLVSQPVGPAGVGAPAAATESLPAASAPAAPSPAASTPAGAYVHGVLQLNSCCGNEVETHDAAGNRLTLRGMETSGAAMFDDPRLTGTYSTTGGTDEFPLVGTSDRVEIWWGTIRIENKDGAWSGTTTSTYDSAQPTETGLQLIELTGEGAYKGLSALLWETSNAARSSVPRAAPFAGAIFPGPLPPR
jgi:hypothetical protein